MTRRHYHYRALLAVSLAACAPRRRPAVLPAPAVPDGFDHVIVAIDSLPRGIALLTALTGIRPSDGGAVVTGGYGAEPGRGVRSALLGLGAGRYLELVAPDPDDPAGAALARYLVHYRTLTPIGWAVRTQNVDSVRRALTARGLEVGPVRPGARRQPDGTTRRWRSLHVWEGVTTAAPFFIAREPGSPPPADAPVGCQLVGFALAYPEPEALRGRLQRAGVTVGVAVGRAASPGIRLTLECPNGTVRLPADAP